MCRPSLIVESRNLIGMFALADVLEPAKNLPQMLKNSRSDDGLEAVSLSAVAAEVTRSRDCGYGLSHSKQVHNKLRALFRLTVAAYR